MNKRIFLTVTLLAFIGAPSIWISGERTPTALAAVDEQNRQQEGHEEDGHAEGDHDEHAGHGHDAEVSIRTTDEHDDHDGHDEHDDHAAGGGICPEHGVPEAEDALCHSDHIGELQYGQGMKVRLSSADAAARAGIRLASPQAISLAQGMIVPGRVQFNRNRLAHITPLAEGVVRRVHVRPGAEVKKGETLAEIAMPEIASLRARLITARARQAQTEATYLREKDLLARGISSRREFQEAESEYQAARSASEQYRQQLQNFGLSPEAVGQLLRAGDAGAVVSLSAPFAGTVTEMHAAEGEAAAPGSPLFTVVDLDYLWIELSIPESRIFLAQEGVPIQALFGGLPDAVFSGRIFQVGASIDERTRTLQALAEVKNPGHRLKAGMFGDVRLLEGDETRTLAVPADSLQSIDGLSYVFLQQEPDLFELRRVRPGAKSDGMVPILAGLSADEQVVSGQGFALKSEVLKARLGASCADH